MPSPITRIFRLIRLLRVRRNAENETTGAPTNLRPGEIAFGEPENKFYVGTASGTIIGGGLGSSLSDFAPAEADLNIGGHKLINVASPTDPTDAANKAYVDATATGLDVKESVRAATTANITLSGLQTIDGVTLVAGDRVLVKNQGAPATNGIYVAAAGVWARSADADTNDEINAGLFTFVEEGTTNGDSGWVLMANEPIALGTTALNFALFSVAGQILAGDGLTKTGDVLNVETADAGRIVVNANNIDLATTGVAPDTYNSVTVDAYGRVTAGDYVAPVIGAGSGTGSILGQGAGNTASGNYSVVPGGKNNTADGEYSSILGGHNNFTNLYTNAHILGSYITAMSPDSVFVNNLAVMGAWDPTLNEGAGDYVGGAIRLPNGTQIAVGSFDNMTGGGLGIALHCYVGYELNWQGGHLRSVFIGDNTGTPQPIYVDSPLEFPGEGADNMQVDATGLTFPDGTTQTGASPVTAGSGTGSIVGQGAANTNGASGNYSVVSGGKNNIASGTGSFVGGGDTNTASGFFSAVVEGYHNNASGNYSAVGGGAFNNSSGNGTSVSGGAQNTASGNYSAVGGGRNNTASGIGSVVSGGGTWGQGNTANGNYSTIGGGSGNTSSNYSDYGTVSGGQNNAVEGYWSVVAGGRNNTASGNYSTVSGGLQAKATHYGAQAHASGQFSNPGDAQRIALVARRETTDATQSELFLNSDATERMVIPGQTTWNFDIKLSAYSTTSNIGASWNIRGAIRRDNADSTVLIGSNISENWIEAGLAGIAVSVTADDTNEALVVQVTGLNGNTIRWVAAVDLTQVSFGTP